MRPVIGAPTPRLRAREALCTAHSSKQQGEGGSSTVIASSLALRSIGGNAERKSLVGGILALES